jgi:DNA-binding Xre family transcriptional regulator
VRKHGTRTMYVHGGCKTDEACPESYTCRMANGDYRKLNDRARLYGRVDLVPAAEARRHLRVLSRAGVGTRQVAQLTGLGRTALCQIKTGETKRIRLATLRAVLEVQPVIADGSLMSAAPTWRQVERILAAGYTRRWISAQIGNNGQALQLGKSQVTGRNARKIARLYASLLGSDGKVVSARRVQDRQRWESWYGDGR